MFDMDQPLSVEKIREYFIQFKKAKFKKCCIILNNQGEKVVLEKTIDSFEFIRKYAYRNIKNTDLQERILGATDAFYRLADPFGYPDNIVHGLTGLMLLRELLEYEEARDKKRGNEK